MRFLDFLLALFCLLLLTMLVAGERDTDGDGIPDSEDDDDDNDGILDVDDPDDDNDGIPDEEDEDWLGHNEL